MSRNQKEVQGGFVKTRKNGEKKGKGEKPEKNRRFPAKAGKNKARTTCGEIILPRPVAAPPVVADIVYQDGIRRMFDLDLEFSGSKYFIIEGAKFSAQVTGFKDNDGKWVRYIEVNLQEVPSPPHSLSALPESACHVSLAMGQIRKGEKDVSRPRGMDDQTYGRKLVIWQFLHEEWEKAGSPKLNYEKFTPFFNRHFGGREVPAILKSRVPTSSPLAEALAPVKEVLERSKFSSSATSFIRGEEGEYAFPKVGPAVLLRMTPRREIVLLEVEEGHPMFDVLNGHAHACRFTIDHLTGATQLPKDVRKDQDPLHVAIRRLCSKLRDFLKPYGLKEVVPVNKPAPTQAAAVRDPKKVINVEQFRNGEVGTLQFEGVKLQAKDGQGGTGKARVEVFVVEVDNEHPDKEFLDRLVGKKLFLSTYVAKLGPDYPRNKIIGKSEFELDAMEALFRLLRRALGYQAEFMSDSNRQSPVTVAVEGVTSQGATIH